MDPLTGNAYLGGTTYQGRQAYATVVTRDANVQSKDGEGSCRGQNYPTAWWMEFDGSTGNVVGGEESSHTGCDGAHGDSGGGPALSPSGQYMALAGRSTSASGVFMYVRVYANPRTVVSR